MHTCVKVVAKRGILGEVEMDNNLKKNVHHTGGKKTEHDFVDFFVKHITS